MPVGLTYPPQGLNTLTNPTIQGTVSAGTGLTLPAFTMAGDISLGANLLKTTNLAIKEETPLLMAIRDASDSDYQYVKQKGLLFVDYIKPVLDGRYIAPPDTDNYYLKFQARDTGVGQAEVARLQGANWAHLLLTRARFGTTALTADVDHRGGLYVEEGGAGVADKLYWIAKNSLDGYEAVQVAVAS
jgi:hypothetical protein